MASDANGGDSKFGFKDKEKAEETLQLLESHDMQYRKLTVRGLLGRAKRVLTMTKAEEKVKNIGEAIAVFEEWLEQNGGGAANKNAKTEKEDKVETVPGLGFKDKEAALATLKILDGRDPDYQRLAVKGLVGSVKRVLAGTKNEDKIKAIKEGQQVLEDFLERFEADNLIKNNRAYLAYALVEQLPAGDEPLAAEFQLAYGGPKAKGNYKHLRTMYPKDQEDEEEKEGERVASWDIVRNREITKLLDQLKSGDGKLFDAETGAPTAIHLALAHWAYSPQPDKLKAYVQKQTTKVAAPKRSAAATDDAKSDEPTRKKKKSSRESTDEDDEDEDDDDDEDEDSNDE